MTFKEQINARHSLYVEQQVTEPIIVNPTTDQGSDHRYLILAVVCVVIVFALLRRNQSV